MIKIAIQQTASHCNWLQGGAIKVEGGTESVLYNYVYLACKELRNDVA